MAQRVIPLLYKHGDPSSNPHKAEHGHVQLGICNSKAGEGVRDVRGTPEY